MKKKDIYLNSLFVKVSINNKNQTEFVFRDTKNSIQVSQNPCDDNNWSMANSSDYGIDRIMQGVTENYFNHLIDKMHLLYKIGDFIKLTIVLDNGNISVIRKEKNKDGYDIETSVNLPATEFAINEFLYPGTFSKDKNYKENMFTKIKDAEERYAFKGLLKLVFGIYDDAYLFNYCQELIRLVERVI